MTANAPYAFAFVAAQLLALPGLAFALYLYLIERVASSGGWLRAFFELLFSGVVVLPFVLLCCVTLLIAGLFASVRPWAAVALVAANIAIVAIALGITPPREIGDLFIWLPAVASTAIAGWLAWRAFSA